MTEANPPEAARSSSSYGDTRVEFQHIPVRAPSRRTFAALLGGLVAAVVTTGATAATPIRLVVLGDSLSAGYQLPQGAAFPEQLQAALRARGRAVEITNAGVSGDTASQGLDRLDWSVPEGTQAVIVELGANDALRGVDPAVTRKALSTIVETLKSRGIAVMLAGMLAPRNMGADYAAAFDRIYLDLAKQYGVPLYPFFLDGVAGVAKLNLRDGIHPTAEGVGVIVERILPSVEAFLSTVKPSS
ncbi:arylesterase [Alsobacter sp. R-9]